MYYLRTKQKDKMVHVMAMRTLMRECHMPQFAKQFNVIEEHYRFVIDDQVGSRIINVFQNILLINK